MKVKKRIVSLLLALVLAAALLGVPAALAAAGDVELSAAETDGVVKVTLTAKTDFTGMSGLEFAYEFDDGAFAITGIDSPLDAAPTVNWDQKKVSLLSQEGVDISAGTDLVTLTFTKGDGYHKGTQYTFALHFAEAFNKDVEMYDWADQSYSAAYGEDPDPVVTGAIDLRGVTIRKTIDTSSAYDPVTFTFTLENKTAPAGATPPSFDPMQVTASGTTDAAVLSLPGEVWVDAPGVYEYTVRELTGVDEGWSFDTASYVLHLEVVSDGAQGYALNQWYAVAPDGSIVTEMEFRNSYVAPQPAFEPPQVRLKIRQVVNLGNSGLTTSDVIVRYTLRGQTADAPLPTGAKDGAFQVALRGTGTYQAPIITYTQPGTWKYTLSATGTNAVMTPESMIITVTVADTGEATVTAALTNGAACEIQFTANAKASPTPSPTPTPKPGTVQTPTPTPKRNSGTTPKTGDTPKAFVFAFIALVATAALSVLAAWEIKDRRKGKDKN